jgi:hypothetical protein
MAVPLRSVTAFGELRKEKGIQWEKGGIILDRAVAD